MRPTVAAGSAVRTRTLLLAASIATVFAFAPALHANPTNPTVVNGSATFGTAGSTLTVTNSPSAIINWQGFSIGAGETTVFQQQSAASAVLNRITGGDASQILGALQSNGQVFIINPAGVVFGAGAQINVAGLVASTLNITDQDFLAGKLNFNVGPLAGAVTNQGTITTPLGGSVILVGTSVENSGVINAPNGNVVLAAGRSVLLGDTAAPNVLAQVQASSEQATNLGQIAVGGGQVGIYAGLIRQSGVVRADSATVDAGGTIVFKATKDITLDAGSVTSASGGSGGSVTIEATGGTNLVSGNISVTGSSGQGGTIQLLGQNVGVIDGASVDASGTTGGGTILIGGDAHGANASVMNANAVYTGANTTLHADATDNGNGGKVILWSDQATRAYGAITARGGANGGNGGFVETSSKGYLDVTQTPDLTAPMGTGGTWLLDPSDIDVIATTGTLDGSSPSFTANANSSTVSNSVINAALNTGASVTIDTNNPAGTQSGNITVSAPITKSTGTTIAGLTLNADNNIVFNAPISDTTGVATSGINLSMTSGRTTTTGSVTMFGGMNLGAGNFTANRDVTLNNPGYTLGGTLSVGGALTLGSNATLAFTGSYSPNSVGSLVLDPNAGGSLTLTGAGINSTYINTGTVTVSDPNASGAGVVYLNGLTIQNFSGGTFALDTHTVTLQNGTTIYMPNITMTSGLINGAGSVTATSNFIATGGAINMTKGLPGTPTTSYASFVNLTQQSGPTPAIPITADSVTLNAMGSSTIDGAAVSSTVSANSLSLAQQLGGITLNAPITADSVSISAASVGSGIALNSTINADSITLTSDAGATFGAATFVPLNSAVLKSLAITQTTGSISITSPLTVDSLWLSAVSAGSGISFTAPVTVNSVLLNTDVAATYTASTFVPMGTRLTSFSLTQGTGDIVLTQPINADSVLLAAVNGSVLHGAGNPVDVTANSLTMNAQYGTIGAAASPLLTSVSLLNANPGGATFAPQTAGWGVHVSNTLAGATPLTLGSVKSGANDVNITNNTDILLGQNCGDGCSAGVASAGGTVTIQAGGNIGNNPNSLNFGVLAPAWISADGSSGSINGGTVNLIAAGNINIPGGTVTAKGYTGLDINGNIGNGGAVNLSAGGAINVGTVSAAGGGYSGTWFFYPSAPAVTPTLSGGAGGSVSMAAAGAVTVGSIDVSGGSAVVANAWNGSSYVPFYGSVEAGGNGGSVAITTNGSVSFGVQDPTLLTWSGGVFAKGGAGAPTAIDGGVGGTGGTVTIAGSGATGMTLNSPVPISVVGGAGGVGGPGAAAPGNGANGGVGGSLDAHTTNGGVLNVVGSGGVVDASGGAGGTGLAIGLGGAGGTVNLASLDATSIGSVNIAGLTITAAGGSGSTPGAAGLAAISAGSGGISQSLAAGDQFATNAPLNIVSGGTVHLDNTANDFTDVFGTVSAGDLFLRDANSIGLGGATFLDTLTATIGNIDVRVPASTASPAYQLTLAGGQNNVAVNQNLTVGGNITLAGDGVVLANGSSLTTGAGNSITFLPLRNLTLTGADASVLNQFRTTTIRLGDATTTASIDLGTSTGPNLSVWLYNSNNLSITTTGNVNQYTAASLVVGDGGGGLQVSAGNVSLTDTSNSFAMLAGRAGTDLTISGPGSFNVTNNGGFTIGTVDSVVGVGTLAGGTLNLTAAGGALSIQALTTIDVNGIWNIVAPSGITNAGTLNLASGASLAQNGAFTNVTGGVVNLNGGTWTRPAGSSFGNAGSGVVNVNNGSLALDGGDGGVGGGTYNIANGASLNLGGTNTSYSIGSLAGAGAFIAVGTGGAGNLTVASYAVSGTNSVSGAFNALSLTSPANLGLKGTTVSANALALSAGTQLLIDGSTLSGGTVTLAAPTVALQSSTSAPSQVTASGDMIVGAPTRLLLDGTNGAAKLTAGGTMTIGAGAVDVLAGAASASIDPTSLTLVSTGNLTLTGGTTSGAAANISGNVVTVYGANVSLAGGSGANSSATITATTGDLGLSTSGTLTMTAGTGANADAALTAPLGGIQVAAANCTGCVTLTADPSVNTTSDVGGFALKGVSFVITGRAAPPINDNSVTQALVVAGSGGSGTSNVSNTPSGDESDSNTQESGGRNGRKKLSVCR